MEKKKAKVVWLVELAVYEVEDESVIDGMLMGEFTDALKKDSENMAKQCFLSFDRQSFQS